MGSGGMQYCCGWLQGAKGGFCGQGSGFRAANKILIDVLW